MDTHPSVTIMETAMTTLLEGMGIHLRSSLSMLGQRCAIRTDQASPYRDNNLKVAQTMEVALASFTGFAHELAASIRYQENMIVRLHGLPSEIFASILLDYTSGHHHLKSVLKLRLVCRQWAQVILNCPLFWRVLDIRNPMAFNTTSLFRAINTPLEIWLWNCDYVKPFMALIEPHCERIKFIHYRGNQPLLVQRLMAHAEEVDVHLTGDESGGHMFELPIHESIRSLQLENACLEWSAITLRNLIDLKLGMMRIRPPTSSELINIIKSSPMLRSLSLNFISDSPGDSEKIHPGERVILEGFITKGRPRIHLRWLARVFLAGLSNTLLRDVTNAFRPAEECTFRTGSLDLGLTLDVMCTAIQDRCMPGKPVTISVTLTSAWPLRFSAVTFAIRTGQEIYLEIHPKRWLPAFRRITELLGAVLISSPVTLTFYRPPWEVDENLEFIEAPTPIVLPWLWLNSWHCLQEIRFLEDTDPRPVLGALGRRSYRNTKIHDQACPLLKSLYIKDWKPEYLPDFDTFLKSRWGNHNTTNEAATAVRPAYLERWDARWNSATFEELTKNVHEAMFPEKGIGAGLEDDDTLDLTGFFD